MRNLVERARKFAAKAHKGQKYGEEEFIVHPMNVATLAEFNHFPKTVIAAAWLHDVLEDTDTTFTELLNEFGTEVAMLVYAVTDKEGKNRRERASKTLPCIRKAGSNAVGLKLCDRLSNIFQSIIDKNWFHKPKLFIMYKKEKDSFKKALFVEGEHSDLWKIYELYLSY